MQPQQDPNDARLAALTDWVCAVTGEAVTPVPASADASFRRYFRFHTATGTVIGMDAPPPQEDCGPFVAIDRLLAAAGVNVPEIIAEDLERGFLLLSDMGTRTWLHAINPDNADDWFAAAIGQLLRIQRSPVPDGFPAYDDALLRRELMLFPEWYLGRHCGVTPSARQQQRLESVFDTLINSALAQSRVLVHRDFMPRNLMVSDPNPGVIDFQDAVLGPVSYDPICLFKDAFLSWPEARVEGWLRDYWQRAREAGIAVPETAQAFLDDCDLMGAQRHLKVIGIFARICHRDGKPHYLEDVPRFFAYLRTVIARQPVLADLGALLDEWQLP